MPPYLDVILSTLLAVVAYLLRQKDLQQQQQLTQLEGDFEEQVALLWQKHDQDAKDLSELRLHIASQHYVKTELDARFDKMELAFQQGFNSIAAKLDKLNDNLVERNL